MKTKAVRLYGVNDLRLEEFELPEIREDEISRSHYFQQYLHVYSQSAAQGAAHKRVPKILRSRLSSSVMNFAVRS